MRRKTAAGVQEIFRTPYCYLPRADICSMLARSHQCSDLRRSLGCRWMKLGLATHAAPIGRMSATVEIIVEAPCCRCGPCSADCVSDELPPFNGKSTRPREKSAPAAWEGGERAVCQWPVRLCGGSSVRRATTMFP